ncbi:hypothetical protein [Chryseobacterium terrae]|uniref:Uncharacterized protein n=1 Tax=Chryseobacterium terrae TaxID=3163299 RepID=A0ABW8XYZ5_9FLAO
MNANTILKFLDQDEFSVIPNRGKWIETGSMIYAKEIKEDIFLLFVINPELNNKSVRAMIAKFDSMENISLKEPKQLMFYLTLETTNDLHYFEKYMNISQLH